GIGGGPGRSRCGRAALRRRHSLASRRGGNPCSSTSRNTSASGRRRYAAASASVSTSPKGPLTPADAGSACGTGAGLVFDVRGMVHSSLFLGVVATRREIIFAQMADTRSALPLLYAMSAGLIPRGEWHRRGPFG